MATDIYVGKRLSFDGQLCTVRYLGEVKGTKGEWLGVEWDDPTRGKHSGENGGVKYFECKTTIQCLLRNNFKHGLTVQVRASLQLQGRLYAQHANLIRLDLLWKL
jgi:dynactin complex subunit